MRTEPAILIGLITAGLALAVSFGVPVTGAQQEAIKNFAEAAIIVAGAYAIRSQVTPVSRVVATYEQIPSNLAYLPAKRKVGKDVTRHE